MKNIEDFFRTNIEVKIKSRKYYSFIISKNNYIYQIDFFFKWGIMILIKNTNLEED